MGASAHYRRSRTASSDPRPTGRGTTVVPAVPGRVLRDVEGRGDDNCLPIFFANS